MPRSDVAEKHCDLPLLRFTRSKRVYVEPSVHRSCAINESLRLTCLYHLAVDLQPEEFDVREELTHRLTHNVAQAALSLEGAIHFEITGVGGITVIEQNFQYTESLIDRLEQRSIPLLASTQRLLFFLVPHLLRANLVGRFGRSAVETTDCT